MDGFIIPMPEFRKRNVKKIIARTRIMYYPL